MKKTKNPSSLFTWDGRGWLKVEGPRCDAPRV
ncbi:hypothetical protein V6Z11_A05G438000 [Gossypium hirsutum]